MLSWNFQDFIPTFLLWHLIISDYFSFTCNTQNIFLICKSHNVLLFIYVPTSNLYNQCLFIQLRVQAYLCYLKKMCRKSIEINYLHKLVDRGGIHYDLLSVRGWGFKTKKSSIHLASYVGETLRLANIFEWISWFENTCCII